MAFRNEGEREKRHQLGTGESCFKSTPSPIVHHVNAGQLVVSFSFLIYLYRQWHFMWDFFCSCLPIPAEAVEATPLGTVTAIKIITLHLRLEGKAASSACWKKDWQSRGQEQAVSALLTSLALPVSTHTSQVLRGVSAGLPWSRLLQEIGSGQRSQSRPTSVHALGLSDEIMVVMFRPSCWKSPKSSLSYQK